MIKVRFSLVKQSKSDLDLEIKAGEKLNEVFDRALAHVKFKEDQVPNKIFKALVNGKEIDPDLFEFTKVEPSDTVLICPIIRGGDNGATMRQIAILAVAITVSAVFPPAAFAAYGAVGGALISAGITMAAVMAVSALIPPSVPQSGALSSPTGISESQMYSISSQGNAVAKFGSVPKVYGRHKIFPRVAANPYTELELDPATGELAQYLYAIYDFGLGPNILEDIRIGDTPISSYAGVQTRIVDFNKPVTSEGIWDDVANSQLSFYKGDVSLENVSVALNGNQNQGDPLSEYQAERSAAENIDNVKQEITLTFVNPNGLYGYSAEGNLGQRAIDLLITFQRDGDPNWYGYNDPTRVDSWDSLGGDDATFTIPLTLFPIPIDTTPPFTESFGPYANLSELGPYGYPIVRWSIPGSRSGAVVQGYYRKVGIPNGATQVVVLNNVEIDINDPIVIKGVFRGYVNAKNPYGPNPSYMVLTLDRTMPAIVLYEYIWQTTSHDFLSQAVYGIDLVTTGKVSGTTTTIGRARIQRQSTSAAYSTFKFTPSVIGDYTVRVTRLYTTQWYSSQVADAFTWLSLSTRFDRAPILTTKRHTFLEMRIKATGQLNGSVSNLSAICNSVLDVYDPDTETWSKMPTSNPAWIVADLLTGEVNKRAITKDRLYIDSFVEWAEYSDEIPPVHPAPPAVWTFPRFECNFVLDYQATLQQVIAQVASSAQASLNIVDGKYGVLMDIRRTTPVQIFTQRNSTAFNASRRYAVKPDGVSVQFVDPIRSYEVSQSVVYEDGKDESNAENVDDLVAFGCTNEEQAWRYGRYMLFANRLRQETITLQVDFEHLICTRGDFVQIQQPAMRVGGTPARVIESNALTGEFTTDAPIEIIPMEDYGFILRAADGMVYKEELTVVDSTHFISDDFDVTPPVGTLVIIGVVDFIAFDCIVKAINPNDDHSATLTLVERADEIHDAESSGEFPEYNPNISPTTDPNIIPPGPVTDLVVADNGYICSGGGYEYYVVLDWDVPVGTSPEFYEVYVDDGRGFNFIDITRTSLFRYVVNQDRLDFGHTFRILAVSSTGRKMNLLESSNISFTPPSKTANPTNVPSFAVDTTTSTARAYWTRVTDCDIQYYIIKFFFGFPDDMTPGGDFLWGQGLPIGRVSKETDSIPVVPFTGTYMIKAVDYDGRESTDATQFYLLEGGINPFNPSQGTSVTNLYQANIAPVFLENMEYDPIDETWVLAQSVPSADPEFREFFLEGYVYPTGPFIDDVMNSFKILSFYAQIDSIIPDALKSVFDVELQYRVGTDEGFMSDWPNLDEVDPLTEYDLTDASEWRTVTYGEVQGVVTQVRLKVSTRNKAVTPKIKSFQVSSIKLRRSLQFSDITTVDNPPFGYGHTQYYDEPFDPLEDRPSVQVTINDGESGDYPVVNSDYEFFYVQIFDASDTSVERNFDATVTGIGRVAP